MSNEPVSDEPVIDSAERLRMLKILMAEYAYWREAELASGERAIEDVCDGIQMGAMGAIANVVAALGGHLAPWHRLALEEPDRPQEVAL
jgi:hypothetical protein